jgi:predicted Zn-dependent protease with MMP-like domain
MIEVSDKEFQGLINEALGELPKMRVDHIKNVAILYEDVPTPEQRTELELRNDQTLLGLYQGVPLSQRQGMMPTLPDKITLFKQPLCARAATPSELKEAIKHTLWHEIAHYYGLNHDQIHNLE